MVNTEMSNLTLKSTNYANMLAAIKAKRGGERGMIRLGSNTEAHLNTRDDRTTYVGVYYHGNLIAELDDDGIWFRNAGWGTPTTRNRLGIIARDNNVPLFFGQKNHAQTLHATKREDKWAYSAGERDDIPRHLITDEFSSIVWDRAGDYIVSAANNTDRFYL